MKAALATFPPREWTTDDLDQLPEDGVRRELIDGVLHVVPTPHESHQTLAGQLMVWLYRHCPPEFAVTQGVEVRISERRSLVPDVQVVTAAASAQNLRKFAPQDVALAVEIVSPTTVTMDRTAKPALYAGAGIPHYWRIETDDGVTVHTYQLDAKTREYVGTGVFDKVVQVARPWRIELPLEDITPRQLRR